MEPGRQEVIVNIKEQRFEVYGSQVLAWAQTDDRMLALESKGSIFLQTAFELGLVQLEDVIGYLGGDQHGIRDEFHALLAAQMTDQRLGGRGLAGSPLSQNADHDILGSGP
jgi:hypothetical protein